MVRSSGDTVATGAAASATAQCQPGEMATGGGAQIRNGNGGAGGTGGLIGNGLPSSSLPNSGLPNGVGNRRLEQQRLE
jgi:hypothetical protein